MELCTVICRPWVAIARFSKWSPRSHHYVRIGGIPTPFSLQNHHPKGCVVRPRDASGFSC
eukprot:14092.XXX_34926_35105_1 [CDS] Oithona nana genome sequencing.